MIPCGADVVSLGDALRTLGISGRTLRRYVRSGRVRRRGSELVGSDFAAGRAGCRRPSEIGLAMLQVRLARAVSETQVCIEVLESRLATLFRLFNLDATPLVLTDPEAHGLYQSAVEAAENGWSPFVEEQWAQTFLRLRIDNLEQFQRVTNDPHPWRVWHRLCSTMLLVPFDKNLKNDLSLGKANLFALVGIWCQLTDVGPREMDAIVARDGVPGRRAINRAARGRAPDVESTEARDSDGRLD